MGSKCQGCAAGGSFFSSCAGRAKAREPRKGWSKLSFALSLAPALFPPPWPLLPEPKGLHIPPLSSSSSSPMSLTGSPHSLSLAPSGVPKHCHGLGDSWWLWQRGT